VAADELDTFGDGVRLVELAPLSDPGLVRQSVATALEVPEEAPAAGVRPPGTTDDTRCDTHYAVRGRSPAHRPCRRRRPQLCRERHQCPGCGSDLPPVGRHSPGGGAGSGR
jgi:hypothetical protein